MIESAEIKNFRAFADVTLSGCSRINIVVGDNGAGKTTLLEALFLGSTVAGDVPSRFRHWRGIEAPPIGNPVDLYKSIFGTIFYNLERNRIGEINLKGTDNDARSVRFYYDTNQPSLLQLAGIIPPARTNYTPVSFEFYEGEGVLISKVTPQIQPQGIAVPPAAGRKDEPTFLPARTPFNQVENASWFSELSKQNKEAKFIDTIKQQFPEIESLSVELELGMPTVFAKTIGSSVKLPANMISDGLSKLITVFLHIARSENTVSFFDELENGLHFSRHQRLWAEALAFASDYKTQMFASTHSWEFLTSALPTMKKEPKSFTIVRVKEDKKNSKRLVTVLPGEEAIPLIEAGIELRD